MTVPIIPLIDVLTILLIFFIVTTTFKKKRHALAIDIPTVEKISLVTLVDERAVLAVSKNGEMALAGINVPDGLLREYLSVFLEKNPDAELELETDEGVTLGSLVGVWEALTDVGVEFREVPTRVRIPAGESGEEAE